MYNSPDESALMSTEQSVLPDPNTVLSNDPPNVVGQDTIIEAPSEETTALLPPIYMKTLFLAHRILCLHLLLIHFRDCL